MGVSRAGLGGLALPLVVAIAAGVLAVWLVQQQIDRAAARGGPPVTVLVATEPIAAGTVISGDPTTDRIGERSIPRDFAPVDAISSWEELTGATLSSNVAAGAFLTDSILANSSSGTKLQLRKGERAVSVGARAAPDGTVLVAGDRVDLIASGFDGAPTSELVLSGAQVLSASESGERAGTQRLTLRIAASQSSAIVRADVFARELRAIKLSANGSSHD